MRVYLRDTRSHINLALLQQYGSNAWRIHNYLNEATAKNIEQTLEELKNLTTEVNRDRKNYQVSVMCVVGPACAPDLQAFVHRRGSGRS